MVGLVAKRVEGIFDRDGQPGSLRVPGGPVMSGSTREGHVKQEIGDSVSTKLAIHTAKGNGRGMDDWETLDSVDPRVARLIADVNRVFCCFSKEVRNLERQARRMRGPLCSEAYNLLLDQQVRKVEGAFNTYLRLREELFTCIKVNSWRTRFHGRSPQVESAGAELDGQATTELIEDAS